MDAGDPALSNYQGEKDTKGIHTIGWGHAMWEDEWYTLRNGKNVNLYNANTVISREDAEDIHMKDMEKFVNTFNKFLNENDVTINQHQYDALLSLGFQNGIDYLVNKQYNLARWVANGDLSDLETAKAAFGSYNDNGSEGTMLRRLDELEIMFYGEYQREDDKSTLNRFGDIWNLNFAHS